MDFEWDEAKRKAVIAQRGVDLIYAALIFEGDVVTAIDDRADYGEVRKISIGMVNDECFKVAHTERGEVTRLITAWKGGRNDRRQYEASIARRHQEDEGAG